MKITKININNFRCINNLSLNFIAPGTMPIDTAIISFRPGEGKTSILDAIYMTLQPWDSFLQRSFNNQNFMIEVELDNGEKILVDPDNKPHKKFSNIEYLKAGRVFYLDHLMMFDDEDGKALIVLNNLWKKFRLLDKRADKEEFVLMDIPFEFEGIKGSRKELGLSGRFSKPATVNYLSHGEKAILNIIVPYLFHAPHILLIDEPELHISTVLHRPLVRALRSLLPDTQIILSTNSEEIYEMVASYQRFFILHDGK